MRSQAPCPCHRSHHRQFDDRASGSPRQQHSSAAASSTSWRGLIRAEEIGLVVMDCALSPVQQRNLEKAWGAKVIDRTGLILIFGRRARTKEGTLQVELAHLSYQKGRLFAPGPTRAPARRLRLPRRPRRDADRGRPASDPGTHEPDRARSGRRREDAPCTAQAAGGCLIRSSPSSAIPMPASRPCSTA